MRRLALLAVGIASVNVVVLTFAGTYDLHLGPLHSHSLFKPLLYLNAAILFAALVGGKKEERDSEGWSPNAFVILGLVTLLYLPSFFLYFPGNDWTHQADMAQRNTLGSLGEFFRWRQPDGFYRPLVFVSLWIDYRIFGTHEWGYHLQNVAFHLLNCLLLMRLALRLGFEKSAARWAALLFGVAAICYEPVMWPGARFDIIATCFVLSALLAALDWATAGGLLKLGAMSLLFALGLFSKESAYCFPPLLLFLLGTRRTWKLPPIPRNRAVQALAAAAAVTGVLLAVRWLIFQGLGGYAGPGGGALHFEFKWTTLLSFFNRALPTPVFALNTSGSLVWWAQAAIIILAVGGCGYAALGRGEASRKVLLIAAMLISALPVANLVDWISAAMRNTRYLYLPGVWICLLLAAGRPRSPWWLAMIAAANAVAAYYNYSAFQL